MALSFGTVLDAFEYVSFGAQYEHLAWIDTESEVSYYYSEQTGEGDELP